MRGSFWLVTWELAASCSVHIFSFEVRQSCGPEGDQRSHWVQVFRTDLLSRDNIDSVCLELLDLAKNTGGDYDGWETPVVK